MPSTSTSSRYFTLPRSLNEPLESAPAASATIPMSASTKESMQNKESVASQKTDRKPGITFSSQEKLHKLPIPDLASTIKKYLEALEPLQSPKEHDETKAAARDFLENDGKELQEKLKQYASDKTSYIEQFWYDSYLNFDNSVVLNLNPFFLLEDDPTPARNDQVTRAASLVISALCFVRAVRKEELPPDTLRGTPLCMYQYSRLFGTARIPTENGCIIGQDSDSKHIVVLARGQFYWFDVLDANNDLIMTEKDLAINLQVIVNDAEQTPIQEAAKGALGVLSTENRKIWSGLRDVLTREEGSNNSECLSIVDSALFVVCLDDTEASDISQLCGNMLCGTNHVEKGVQIGTCTNRWYDKLQIIVCKNGSAGINFEHTGVDGHTVLRFASDVYTDTILRFARSINGLAPSLWASNSPDPSKRDPESFGEVSTTPHKLEWDMVPELSIALRFAEARLADLIQQNEFYTLDFMHYGKNFITGAGLSPDAYVQMAFQAAYYGLYGRIENTYEPAMTKIFLHGRTEAIRSVTPESFDFIKAFWADQPAQKKVDALKKATQKHTTITKECSKAQGQDRHLYALYCIWQRAVDEAAESSSSAGISSNGYSSPVDGSEIGSPRRTTDGSVQSTESGRQSSPGGKGFTRNMPDLFTDSGWDKLNTTILSTSNCGNPSLRHFGFGPVSADGFGIGYIIKDDSISVCVSSKHRQTKRFVEGLESYLLEMRRLIRSVQRTGSAGKASRAREAEERPHLVGRLKSRGRLIKGSSNPVSGIATPTTESAEIDDEGLGGYGFFDAGMLLQALKTNKERPSDAISSKRKAVGRKLRLEY